MMAEIWPAAADLRGWLGLLAERGELRRLGSEIDPEYDVAAVLEHADGQYAVAFDDVRGAAFPLAGNTMTSRSHFAVAMGCADIEVVGRIQQALREPRPCAFVEPGDAPVLANHDAGGDLLGDLPLPVQHELDAGRYFTSALVVARDTRTGRTNLSINRLQVTGPREVRALLLPGRLRSILAEHEASGSDLQVALCVGVDPLLASQSPARPDLDDLEVVSALHPGALPVVRIGALPVPAGAEMVLVGSFQAGRREEEGPFGEYPLTYGPAGPAPVLQLTDRYYRDDARLQTVLSGGREHFWLGGLPREARLLEALRGNGVDVAGVRLTEGSSCRMHAVISLPTRREGTPRHAIMTACTAIPTVKLVTVVDDDVDVFDDEQVEWAVATRMQADRDLLVIPHTIGSSLDPSADGSTSAKLGIDATKPLTDNERFAKMRTLSAKLDSYVAELED
ncbi:MAG: UbiD family decarboxylase [Streptosporangiales bacterium]|nr:UbiD family decarboxylase [Streptosporangiales bacterium]